MSRLPALSAVVTAASVAACIPIAADGAFRVQGEILGTSDLCELQLFRDGQRGTPLQSQKVSGAFLETFVVVSSATTYRVDLWCNGSVQRSLTVRYEDATTYENPARFGKVAL